jgi:hypothetical protein
MGKRGFIWVRVLIAAHQWRRKVTAPFFSIDMCVCAYTRNIESDDNFFQRRHRVYSVRVAFYWERERERERERELLIRVLQ